MQHYEVVIIGSGFAGIGSAIKLKTQGIDDFLIVEREVELGGTWWRNNYPGAQVDVLSSLYSFSFEHYDWTRLFAKQPEILAYTQSIIAKHQLHAKARTSTAVTHARYDEATGHWILTLNGSEEISAGTVINAIGHLSQAAIPEITGQDSFTGEQFHSSRWNHDYEWHGKKIAVIGTAASGLQIVPAVAEHAAEVHVFQRTPHWIVPRHDKELSSLTRRLQRIPLLYKMRRAWIYAKAETRVVAFQYFPVLLRLIAEKEAKHHIAAQINDEELKAKVTPTYTIGCKRILLSDKFYPALCQDNVTLHTDGIEAITPTGITTKKGEHIDVDLIVYATGFQAFTSNACMPYDGIGENGHSLKADWQDGAHAYVGCSVPNFPNFFHLNGPNTGIGHTSAVFMTESQLHYVVGAIVHKRQNQLKSIAIKPEVERRYNAKLQRLFRRSVWETGGCDSWYTTQSGKQTTIFPTFTFRFKYATRRFNPKEHILQR